MQKGLATLLRPSFRWRPVALPHGRPTPSGIQWATRRAAPAVCAALLLYFPIGVGFLTQTRHYLGVERHGGCPSPLQPISLECPVLKWLSTRKTIPTMRSVSARPRIISKTAVAAPHPFNGAANMFWLLVLLSSIVGPCSSQSLSITQYPTAAYPQFIDSGPDGALWFTEQGPPPKVARITTSGAITEFAVSNQPFGITKGPDGALWFAEFGNGASKIGRIDPTFGMITEYPLPNANAAPYTITLGPDGALWFTENAGPIFRSGA